MLTITVFYSIADGKIVAEKELDVIDADMNSFMRECVNKGFKVNNYQDRSFH